MESRCLCYNTYQVRTYLQIHELGPPIYRVAEGRNFGTCRTMTTIKRVDREAAGSTLSTNVRHDGQIEWTNIASYSNCLYQNDKRKKKPRLHLLPNRDEVLVKDKQSRPWSFITSSVPIQLAYWSKLSYEEMLGQEPKCIPHKMTRLSIRSSPSLELTCCNIEYATCAVQVLSMASVSGCWRVVDEVQ